jgi:hypothetical protein
MVLLGLKLYINTFFAHKSSQLVRDGFIHNFIILKRNNYNNNNNNNNDNNNNDNNNIEIQEQVDKNKL